MRGDEAGWVFDLVVAGAVKSVYTRISDCEHTFWVDQARRCYYTSSIDRGNIKVGRSANT